MLGGTFNPPHWGHLKMAEQACASFSYDKIVFVPSFRPAHKSIEDSVSFEQRLSMIHLAAKVLDNAFVSDCEGARKGISYSIDTVRFLKAHFCGNEKPGLLIGDDLVPGFKYWHKVEELVHEADVIICHRDKSRPIVFPWPHRYMENPPFPLSSSEIRKKIRSGEDASSFLPPGVYEYILKEGLYAG